MWNPLPWLETMVLHTVNNILNAECADCKNLPYSIYIEYSVSSPDIPVCKVPCLLLVVPESNYNISVPLRLGTNLTMHV